VTVPGIIKDKTSNDEIGLKKIGGVDPDQGDRISGREVDHGIPSDDIIAVHVPPCNLLPFYL
jgi:hypothetical protein